MAAIEAARCLQQQEGADDREGRVLVLEATRAPLSKVAKSGGGRCNVTPRRRRDNKYKRTHY